MMGETAPIQSYLSQSSLDEVKNRRAKVWKKENKGWGWI